MSIIILGAASFCIAALILCIKLWKTKNPGRVATVFAVIAFVCALIHLACQFYPFEYKGGKGIDYIGQALVFGMAVNAVLYTTLAAYLFFAVIATIYVIKSFKKKESAGRNIVTLLIAWVFAVVFACFIVTNVVKDKQQKKNISVTVQQVEKTVDSEGKPAIIVIFGLKNDTNNDITYLGSIYGEVTQGGKELSHASVNELIGGPDYDLEKVKPGTTGTVKKAYVLNDQNAPVKIICRTYGGDVTYVDKEVTPPSAGSSALN